MALPPPTLLSCPQTLVRTTKAPASQISNLAPQCKCFKPFESRLRANIPQQRNTTKSQSKTQCGFGSCQHNLERCSRWGWWQAQHEQSRTVSHCWGLYSNTWSLLCFPSECSRTSQITSKRPSHWFFTWQHRSLQPRWSWTDQVSVPRCHWFRWTNKVDQPNAVQRWCLHQRSRTVHPSIPCSWLLQRPTCCQNDWNHLQGTLTQLPLTQAANILNRTLDHWSTSMPAPWLIMASSLLSLRTMMKQNKLGNSSSRCIPACSTSRASGWNLERSLMLLVAPAMLSPTLLQSTWSK